MQAKRCLEAEIGFSTIFPPAMGIPAGQLMNRILAVRPGCPLLNVLLVSSDSHGPSYGAGVYMARYLGRPELENGEFRKRHPNDWRAAAEEIATVVYAFDEWDQVYFEAFGQPLLPLRGSRGSRRRRHPTRSRG